MLGEKHVGFGRLLLGEGWKDVHLLVIAVVNKSLSNVRQATRRAIGSSRVD